MHIELKIRHYIIFALGVFGIIYETAISSDTRTTLLVTDLILLGIIPIDLLLDRISKK